MENMEKRIIEDVKFRGFHCNTDPDADGRVELYWSIRTQDGFRVDIYINRFEVHVPDTEDPLELVIPLKGYYKNQYALSADSEAADKAFAAAHGLIKAMRQISYTALR
jgi:hypothetical protein